MESESIKMNDEQLKKEYQDYLDYQEYQKYLQSSESKKDERSPFSLSAEGLKEAAMESIPMAGATAGGFLGSALGPLGSVGGAGLGYSGGKILQKIISDPSSLIKSPTAAGLGSASVQVPLDVASGAAQEVGGQLTGKLISSIPAVGKKIYDLGMSKIPKEARDILFTERVFGSPSAVASGMQNIIDREISRVNEIAREAAKAGGDVDMVRAMQPSIARIHEIRMSKDPQLQPLANELEKQVSKYLALNKKPAETVLRELPVQANYIPAHSEVSFSEPIKGSLPVKSSLAPSSQDISFSAPIKGSLPVQSKFAPPYSKQVGIDKYTLTPISKEVPGEYIPQPEVDFSYRNVVPGKLNPEMYIQNPEVPFSYRETIPGKTYEESYIQRPGVAFLAEKDSQSFLKFNPKQNSFSVVKPEGTAVEGVDPLTALGYKRSITSGIPERAWQMNIQNPEYYAAQKGLASGIRQAQEESVGKALGPIAELETILRNQKAGALLDSVDEMARRAAFSQTSDPIKAASIVKALKGNIPSLLAGGAADSIKQALPSLGLAISDVGQAIAPYSKSLSQAVKQSAGIPLTEQAKILDQQRRQLGPGAQ